MVRFPQSYLFCFENIFPKEVLSVVPCFLSSLKEQPLLSDNLTSLILLI